MKNLKRKYLEDKSSMKEGILFHKTT